MSSTNPPESPDGLGRQSLEESIAAQVSPWRGSLLPITISMALFYVSLAFQWAAVSTSLPAAMEEFNAQGNYGQAFSMFTAFSLIGMALAGSLCDHYPLGKVHVLGASCFMVGLLITGFAPSAAILITGRAFQGLGAGVSLVTMMVIIARVYPKAARPAAMGMISAAWVLPSVIGPSIAGAIAEYWNWRISFLGVILLAAPAALVLLRTLRHVQALRMGIRRRPIAAAGISFIGVFILSGLSSPEGWVTVALVVGSLVFVVVGARYLLPRGTAFFQPGIPTIIAMRGVMASAFFICEIWIPLVLHQERGWSLTLAGVGVAVGAIGWAVGGNLQARFGSQPGHERRRTKAIVLSCITLAFVFVGQILLLTPITPAISLFLWAVGSLAMGLSFGSLGVLLFEFSEPKDQARNSASLQLSDALATAVASSMVSLLYAILHASGQEPLAYTIIFSTAAAMILLGALFGHRIVGTGSHRLRLSSRA